MLLYSEFQHEQRLVFVWRLDCWAGYRHLFPAILSVVCRAGARGATAKWPRLYADLVLPIFRLLAVT